MRSLSDLFPHIQNRLTAQQTELLLEHVEQALELAWKHGYSAACDLKDQQIFRFDGDKLDFDFYSTRPAVYEIKVGSRVGRQGHFAVAVFRVEYDAMHIEEITTWGETAKQALDALLLTLRQYKRD